MQLQQGSAADTASAQRATHDTTGGSTRRAPRSPPKILHSNYFQASPFILLFDRRTLARVGLRSRLPELSSPRSQPSLLSTDLPISRSAPGLTTGAGSYRASNQAKLGRIPGPISIFRPAPRLFAGAAIRPRHASLPAWTGSPASRAHFALGYSVRRLC